MFGSNAPRTLAWEPLDSLHILACPRHPLEKVLRMAPSTRRFFEKLELNAPNECCRNAKNIEIEAWYSSPEDERRGVPDIYKLHCSCGRCHVSFCVGGSIDPVTKQVTHPRPFWEIR
jgi:hypothetical protein